MESLVWFPIDYILREINRENQLVTLDDILIFGVQGFLKIQIIIDTNGDLFTYSLVEKRYLCSDVEYGKCWSIFPTAEQDMLQKLRKNQSVMIDSILVSGDWGDPKIQCIEFKEPREVSRENLVLWHEEYKKLRSLLFPSPELISEIEKANTKKPDWWKAPQAEPAQSTLTLHQSEPDKSKSRVRRISLIAPEDAALETLRKKLKREPDFEEFWSYITEHDDTGTIADYAHDRLMWTGKDGRNCETAKLTMRNRLAEAKRRNPFKT